MNPAGIARLLRNMQVNIQHFSHTCVGAVLQGECLSKVVRSHVRHLFDWSRCSALPTIDNEI